jgi:hypothetical protein
MSESVLRFLPDGVEQDERDVLADDRSGLEQALVLGTEPIDSGREHRLNRHRNLGGVNRTGCAIGSTPPDENPRLGERSHAFL